MTDKEYVDHAMRCIVGACDTSCRFYNPFVESHHCEMDMEAMNSALDVASKALEKADKYKWHDLRKNPDDLPDVKGRSYVPVLIIRTTCSAPEYCEYGVVDGYGCCFIGSLNQDFFYQKEIIAWREIEPFEEVE